MLSSSEWWTFGMDRGRHCDAVMCCIVHHVLLLLLQDEVSSESVAVTSHNRQNSSPATQNHQDESVAANSCREGIVCCQH